MRHLGEIAGMQVAISSHAATRMVEMDMQPHEIELTLASPEEVYDSKKYDGARCFRRGRFSLATKQEGDVTVIITALYARMSDWEAADSTGGLGEGRALRYDTGIPQ